VPSEKMSRLSTLCAKRAGSAIRSLCIMPLQHTIGAVADFAAVRNYKELKTMDIVTAAWSISFEVTAGIREADRKLFIFATNPRFMHMDDCSCTWLRADAAQ
jgi:hypothetical protein